MLTESKEEELWLTIPPTLISGRLDKKRKWIVTAAAVLTTGLLAGSGSLNAGAGTIPAETTVSGTTVEAQTAGEDAGTEGEKAADGESTDGRCEGAGLP